eukprot:5289805-Prymnesium_polylepis.1
MPETGDVMWYIVYALMYKRSGDIMYIGSDKRDGKRMHEHLNGRSGCPRVITTTQREWHQPPQNHFVGIVLWEGMCTSKYAKAIEQGFMDKYKTKIEKCPEEDGLVNCDLYDQSRVPLKLNIQNASTDKKAVEKARLEIVEKYTPLDEQTSRMQDKFKMWLVEMSRAITDSSSSHPPLGPKAKVVDYVNRFRTRGEAAIPVREVQTALMDLRKSCDPEVDKDMYTQINTKLLAYNEDKRGRESRLKKLVVIAEFNVIAAAGEVDIATESLAPKPSDGIKEEDIPFVKSALEKSNDMQKDFNKFMMTKVGRTENCDRCEVARTDEYARMTYSSEQDPAKKQACCLIDHALVLHNDQIMQDGFKTDLIQEYKDKLKNDKSRMCVSNKAGTVRKLVERFMKEQFDVEPLAKGNTGAKQQQLRVSLYEKPKVHCICKPLKSGKVKTTMQYKSSALPTQFSCVFMGFKRMA